MAVLPIASPKLIRAPSTLVTSIDLRTEADISGPGTFVGVEQTESAEVAVLLSTSDDPVKDEGTKPSTRTRLEVWE